MVKNKGSEKILVGDLVGQLNKHAPFAIAEEWDNVGLLAGDPTEEVRGIVTAVDLGTEALASAQKHGANLIICHHPPLFKPALRLTKTSHPHLYEALRRGYSVVALHTNYDLSSRETSKKIAASLGFEVADFIEPSQKSRLLKFVTYVPIQDSDKVREALGQAGAGSVGNYSFCSFVSEGIGSFKGGEGSNPAIGKPGTIERVKEHRIEVILPEKLAEATIRAAKKVHPYEEMAYELIPLSQTDPRYGYGFVSNDLEKSLAFRKLVENVKETFLISQVTVSGPGLENPAHEVKRVAFSQGSGSGFVRSAKAKGADVYICGEVGYHQILEARQLGLTLVQLGHGYSERFFVKTIAEWCKEIFMHSEAIEVYSKVHNAL